MPNGLPLLLTTTSLLLPTACISYSSSQWNYCSDVAPSNSSSKRATSHAAATQLGNSPSAGYRALGYREGKPVPLLRPSRAGGFSVNRALLKEP